MVIYKKAYLLGTSLLSIFLLLTACSYTKNDDSSKNADNSDSLYNLIYQGSESLSNRISTIPNKNSSSLLVQE